MCGFSADLAQCFSRYKAVVEFMRATTLFGGYSVELKAVVDAYMRDMNNFSRQDMALNAVHAVHKLHPLDYKSPHVKAEWLMAACVRQHKFAVEFPMERLNFHNSYTHYV